MALCTTSAPLVDLQPPQVAATRQRPLLADSGPMTLRVRTRGCEERLVQIRSAKCTVGSAAGCTLRIHAAGMGPLDCWILRGSAGTVVRRLHGGATLNGGAFCESALKAGDRLRIGSVELEIVECNPPLLLPPAVTLPPAARPAPSLELEELTAELAAMREQNVRLEGEARQGFQSSIMAAERANQLRDALAAAHEQLRDNSRELNETQETIARQSEQWESCQAELAAIRGQRASDAAQIEEVRQASVEAAVEAANELARLENEVAQARSVLTNESDRWQQERTQLERRLEQREAELVAVRSSATAQTSSMTVMIDEIARSKQTVEEELEARSADLQARSADLEAQLAQRQSEAATSHGEIESLRRIVGEQTIIEGRFEKLTRDYDVRCIELEEARSQVAAAAAASSRAAEEAEERAGALQSWQEELTGREQRLVEAQQTLNDERETMRADGQRIEADRQQLKDQQEQLVGSRNELDNQREDLVRDRSDLECQREQLATDRGELDGQREQLNSHRAEMEAEREQLAVEQAALAEQRAQPAADREQIAVSQAAVQVVSHRESQLEQHAAEVEQQIAAANARLAELEQLREQLTAEREANTELAQELDQRQHELETRGQELDARSSLLESLRQDLDQQAAALAEQQAAAGREPATLERDPALERESDGAASSPLCTMPMSAISGGVPCNVTGPWEPPAAFSDDRDVPEASLVQPLPAIEPPQNVDIEPPPTAANPSESGSVDLVLSRLVKAGLWRDGEQPEAAAQVAAPSGTENDPDSDIPLPSGTADLAGHRDSTGVSSEEESIESYMERLLKRVKGDSAILPASMGPASQAPPAASPKSSPAPVEQPTPEADLEQSEYSPRRTAPELSTSLTAMRDLANSAARSAIDRHVRKNTGKQATGKLLGACLTVTTSAVLSYWAWRTHSFQAAVGAGIGGAAGMYWTFAAIRRLLGLMRLNRQQAKAAASAEAKETSSATP